MSTTGYIFGAIVVLGAGGVALLWILRLLYELYTFITKRGRRVAHGGWQIEVIPDESGYVYFATVRDDPDAPIKIGMTTRDPRRRLPEVATMSPYPLRIVYAYRADHAHAEEARVHHELAMYRQHGEWFDRDAVLAYIDHLKEVSAV